MEFSILSVLSYGGLVFRVIIMMVDIVILSTHCITGGHTATLAAEVRTDPILRILYPHSLLMLLPFYRVA